MSDPLNEKKKTNEKVSMGMNAITSIIAASAILVMVNYLGARHYLRSDWTASGVYTLSDKTQSIVKNLSEDVEIYVLWSRADPFYWFIDELLKGYTSLSPRIKITKLDPDRNPDQFRMIWERYGKIKVNEFGQAGVEAGVLLVKNDNVKFIASENFHEYGDYGLSQEEPMLSFRAEGEITSALIAVTILERQTICFTTGHGEWSFEGVGRETLRHIKRELELDGFDSASINFEDKKQIPEFCNVVVVAGPKNMFLETDVKIIENYFNQGGQVLLLLDPIFDKTRFVPTGFESFTAKNGIILKNNIIVETDPRRLISESPVTIIADRFYNHDAVKPLYRQDGEPTPKVVFSIARSMEQKQSTDVLSAILATTSSLSYGKVDPVSLMESSQLPAKDEFDKEGPLAIVMSSVRSVSSNKKARMIVVGDSAFLNEELFINAGLYNRDFWSSSLGWLTSRKELVSIAPKNPEHVQLMLSESEFGSMAFFVLCIFLSIVFSGIYIRIKRRK